jgi:hypothetical protein
MYINGTQVSSQARGGSIPTSTSSLQIGGDSLYGQYFNGLIDEVRVYNRALTQAEIQTDMSVPVGSPLMLLGEEIANSIASPLTNAEIRPIFDEAVERWQLALNDTQFEQLHNVRIVVMNLPGSTLGLAASSVVYVDTNAAGYGWFVDATPEEDSEFVSGAVDGRAHDKVDLLSVLIHELGHILGFSDDDVADPYGNNVMADVLPLGVRRIPQAATTTVSGYQQMIVPGPAEKPAMSQHAANGPDIDWIWTNSESLYELLYGKYKRMP